MPDPAKRIDLGSGHSFQYVTGHEQQTPYSVTTADGVTHENLIGIIEWHLDLDERECGGSVLFAGYARTRPDGTKGPEWQVNSLDPLDLSPSIHCHPDSGGCGSHGYIREGRWVDA